MTEKTTQAFFTLLRAGLWGQPVDSLDCFPMDEKGWKDLYELSIKQTMEAVVFDAVAQLETGLGPQQTLLRKWLVRTEKIAQRNVWIDRIVAQQVGLFENNGADPMLVKGQGLAHCYPKPERRLSGDIDWYFATKQGYETANALVRKAGINLKTDAGFSSSYLWNQCEVEHHQKLIDLHNPFCQSYVGRLQGEEKQRRVAIVVGDRAVLLASPLMQCLQVSSHILKHLLSFGVGLRQLCDLARVYYTYHNQINAEQLKAVYQKVKIDKWVALLHELLVEYIGLPKEYLPFENETAPAADWMLDDILAGGNFGFYTPSTVKPSKRDKGTIWRNAIRYFPYAPMEALSFPIVHFYSRFTR